MRVFTEQPLVIGIVGGAAAALLFYAWLETGRKGFPRAILAVLAATVVLIAVERTVRTDREVIRATLHQIARLVELNEVSSALDFVHSSSRPVRERTEAVLTRYRFQRAEIKRNLKIEIDQESIPKMATAKFNAVAVLAKGAPGDYGERPIPVYLEVSLRKDGNDWRVLDYRADRPLPISP